MSAAKYESTALADWSWRSDLSASTSPSFHRGECSTHHIDATLLVRNTVLALLSCVLLLLIIPFRTPTFYPYNISASMRAETGTGARCRGKGGGRRYVMCRESFELGILSLEVLNACLKLGQVGSPSLPKGALGQQLPRRL